MIKKYRFLFFSSLMIIFLFFVASAFVSDVFAQHGTNVAVKQGELGFKIPDFATILTFAIRFFFIVAGIAALAYGLWGAASWVMSGGEQENIEKARNKIVAAVVGIVLVVVVLAIIVTMEQFVFQKRVCFGLSCPVVVPGIIERCLPNPQYGRYSLPASDWTDIQTSYGMVIDDNVECCPYGLPKSSPYRDDIRLTTGWGAGTKNFGNYDFKICCIYGDRDGNQICDGWDAGIGIYAL